jgi:hypothetical protein
MDVGDKIKKSLKNNILNESVKIEPKFGEHNKAWK